MRGDSESVHSIAPSENCRSSCRESNLLLTQLESIRQLAPSPGVLLMMLAGRRSEFDANGVNAGDKNKVRFSNGFHSCVSPTSSQLHSSSTALETKAQRRELTQNALPTGPTSIRRERRGK